jgi:hypothetical protein
LRLSHTAGLVEASSVTATGCSIGSAATVSIRRSTFFTRNAPVHPKDETEGVIAAQARNPGGGLIVMPDSFNTVNREPIIALAARYEVPTISISIVFFGTRRPDHLWC